MDIDFLLPLLLGLAWLLPLASFVSILLFGPRMGKGGYYAAFVATAAIISGFVFSVTALALWLIHNPLEAVAHGAHHAPATPHAVSGDWYTLGSFGTLQIANGVYPLQITIGYYIDGLTLAMFTMVTLVASCIHVYSLGYMHGELHEVADMLAPLEDGRPVKRRGRFCRFFQCLSLFCFSMLGLVIAGNVAMVFVFWELVGICSYLLIGFWYERRSASNAANKAFIVNRVGDFGMLIGLMALWAGLGTFSFGDYELRDAEGHSAVLPGIFSQVRPAAKDHHWQIPDGMVKRAAASELEQRVTKARAIARSNPALARFAEMGHRAQVETWRSQGYGYGLMVLAGLGLFCGCVGKSAQFPLHVWLPDAMEGPTPVSALIHAATMVAAGVYLVGRLYPIFTPEVLLVIACVGCITLFMAATIALTATDIKRVLAYSTVSQLGFMMLALGLGGWLAGMFHLFTHAFFKSLLFLCSGSVIHSCGTNEMPMMGGLRKKMPVTAYTMLVGCLAIAGAGIPTVIGLSGFHSKDYIFAQDFWFWTKNPRIGGPFFYVALAGAGLTAFYMFRLWYMTFAGNPRDGDVHFHAHESPRSMTIPLMILAVPAIASAWTFGTGCGLGPLLAQARPAGIYEGISHGLYWPGVQMPAEYASHTHEISFTAEWSAFGVALLGFVLATAFYGLRKLDPEDVRRTFAPVYWFLVHKWWFDELYAALFVRPILRLSAVVAFVDRRVIDWLADSAARAVTLLSRIDDWIDRIFVDALVNRIARWTYALGLRLRVVQTGNVRQYVMWIVVCTIGLFVLMSLYWNYAIAGM
jgi:NADH:ubiquinone oxidoreductase subunit 5 (subunit L)/multisubunit Na+/H+ antiporter MnhA subunit